MIPRAHAAFRVPGGSVAELCPILVCCQVPENQGWVLRYEGASLGHQTGTVLMMGMGLGVDSPSAALVHLVAILIEGAIHGPGGGSDPWI